MRGATEAAVRVHSHAIFTAACLILLDSDLLETSFAVTLCGFGSEMCPTFQFAFDSQDAMSTVYSTQ